MKCWGNPSKILTVNNNSSDWEAELFWIDENSCCISRGRIKPKSITFDAIAVHHVWAVVVYSSSNVLKHSPTSRSKSRGHSRKDQHDVFK